MRRNCRFHGEVICIKNGKYGSMYVPKEESAPKEGKKPSGDNAFDRLREDIERIKDENIKRNRDNLDALYNIDMRNMSASMKRLFASWSDGIKKANASVETSASAYESAVKLIAEYKTETSASIAAVEAKANANSASITSLTKWQSEVDSSIQSTAQIQQTVKENEARISLLVNSNGDGLTESAAGIIATAIAGEESLVKIIADNVELTGYVQFTDLDNDGGSTVISGNLITMIMDGSDDDGRSDLESKSKLKFKYKNGTSESTFAHIFTSVDGDDSDVTSRYALYIQTNPFENSYGKTARPAIKINAYGNISLESDNGSIYAASQYGYILSEAEFGTRIRAVLTYEDMVLYGISASVYDYVFARDGIYFGTHKLVDNPYNQ